MVAVEVLVVVVVGVIIVMVVVVVVLVVVARLPLCAPHLRQNPASHRRDNDYVLPGEFGHIFCVRIGARLGA